MKSKPEPVSFFFCGKICSFIWNTNDTTFRIYLNRSVPRLRDSKTQICNPNWRFGTIKIGFAVVFQPYHLFKYQNYWDKGFVQHHDKRFPNQRWTMRMSMDIEPLLSLWKSRKCKPKYLICPRSLCKVY